MIQYDNVELCIQRSQDKTHRKVSEKEERENGKTGKKNTRQKA